MKRCEFFKSSFWVVVGMGLVFWMSWGELVFGYGDFRYKVDFNWGVLNVQFYLVKDCYELVQDKQGWIILLINYICNNVLIYNCDGWFLDVWGIDFFGVYGLMFKDEGGEEFFYIIDMEWYEVIKIMLNGRVVWAWVYFKVFGVYDFFF